MYNDYDHDDCDDECIIDLAGMLCTQVLMAEGRDSKATNTFSRFFSKQTKKEFAN